MLIELYPRVHRRFSSLPLLGSHVDDFIAWLREEGYPRVPICRRVQQLPRVDRALRRRGVRRVRGLAAALLVGLAPEDSQDDICFAATVRSLAKFFESRGLLVPRGNRSIDVDGQARLRDVPPHHDVRLADERGGRTSARRRRMAGPPPPERKN